MSRNSNTKQGTKATKPAFVAYHVPDRENAFWSKIGAAWKHEDGEGFTLQLDLMPIASGRIVLREYHEKEAGA